MSFLIGETKIVVSRDFDSHQEIKTEKLPPMSSEIYQSTTIAKVNNTCYNTCLFSDKDKSMSIL